MRGTGNSRERQVLRADWWENVFFSVTSSETRKHGSCDFLLSLNHKKLLSS